MSLPLPRERPPGVEVLRFGSHAQGIVIAANLDAFAATFAQIRNENAEDAAGTGSFLFRVAEDGGDVAVSERHLIENALRSL